MSKISRLPPLSDDDVSGDETVPVVKNGITRRAALGALAAPAILQAETARDAALAASGPIYSSVSNGEPPTPVGNIFFVAVDGVLSAHRRIDGGSDQLFSYPTAAALGGRDGGKLMGMPDGGDAADAIQVAATPPALIASVKPLFEDTTVRTADGHLYRVLPAGTSEYHLETGGGAKLEVLPGGDGSLSIDAFAPTGDMTARLQAILDRATRLNPVRLKGGSKVGYQIDGHLHIPPYATVDLLDQTNGAWFNLGANGKITQDGCSFVRGTILATAPGFVGPAFEFDADINSAQPSFGDYQTAFDVSLRGDRQPGSKSIRIHSSSGAKGFAWLRGRADVREFDNGPELAVEDDGYINSNDFYFRVFGAKIFYTETIGAGATRQIAANKIKLEIQTGRPVELGKAERAMTLAGNSNTYDFKVWDWSPNNADYTKGSPVVCTSDSFNNVIRGDVSLNAFTFPPVSDFSGRNRVEVTNGRILPSQGLPLGTRPYTARGEGNNVLAHAAARYPVTFTGDQPDGGTEWRAFAGLSGDTRWTALTNAAVQIDLGVVIAGTDVSGVEMHFNPTRLPQSLLLEASQDGAAWTTILDVPQPSICRHVGRFDALGVANLRYLRLTMGGNGGRVDLVRWSLFADDFSTFRHGAFVSLAMPQLYGALNIRSRTANAWYSENAALQMNGVNVMTLQGGPRPIASGVTSVGTAALPYSVVFAQDGTIQPSDSNLKQWRGTPNAAELRAARRIAAELGFYQWISSVAEKGPDHARYHFGPRAQEVWAIMAEEGLINPLDNATDPTSRYAFLCWDQWSDEISDDGVVIQEAGSRFGVRPDQLALFLIAAQEARLVLLEAAAAL